MPIENRECFLVNLRDGLACQRCGRAPTTRDAYHRGFEYHHRQHRAAGGPDVAANLVLACHACHRLHHDGKTNLAELPSLPTPATFACAACGAANDARTVEMNCGWYRCRACRKRVHLFDHAGLSGPLSPVPGGEG